MTQASPLLPGTQITVEQVHDLAVFAALPLTRDRAEAVAVILNAWLPDAHALSMKMSSAIHQTLVPITVITHPGTVGEEA